jgi:hypothetical protein
MLYWICPECGHECSPAIRECPTCTATDILSLAQSLQSKPVSPACPTRSQPVKLAISPVPPPLAAPAVLAATSPQSEFRLKQPGLASTNGIVFEAAALRPLGAHEQLVEPAPSRRRSVAFIRPALTGVKTSGLALSEFVAPGEIGLTPKAGNETPGEIVATEINPAPLPPKMSLAFISSKLELAGASLSELLHAFEKAAKELEDAAIRAIQASFQAQPTELLLCGAPEIVTAPAAPTEQWMRSPRLVFVPKAPGSGMPAIVTAEPQPPTLAGPHLPPQLLNFTRSQGSNRPTGRRPVASILMVCVLVVVLLLGAGSLLQYLSANREAKAASIAPDSTRTSEPAPAPPIPVAEEHPGARFVEVAGLRVVTAPNRKPQLQYIVINHSAGELTGLNIHIALHSANSPSGVPLIRVSSIVPSLGANQSKEIRTDLDAGLGVASIPDWQSLRPDILVARQ